MKIPSIMKCLKIFLLLPPTIIVSSVHFQEKVLYDGCEVEEYYRDLLSISIDPLYWSRSSLESLLQSTHRGILPYTNKYGDDVWKALKELDGYEEQDTVRLVYTGLDIPAEPKGVTGTWNREHIWPKSLGIEESGGDFVDIHHIKPSNIDVNAARGNKLFGDCTKYTSANSGDCTVPATDKAASDTATDDISWLPPANVRGDVARIMMYMDVRYSGNRKNELDLQLVDCPETHTEMGYLFQVLQWHQQDPVSNYEIQRNNRACERWQGNRNPFVDFPELAETLFGTINTSVECLSLRYEPINIPTIFDSTTESISSKTFHSSSRIQPGSIMITRVNSDDPDVIKMVALREIPAGTTLFVTDNAWTGHKFRSNEGTIKLVVPAIIAGGETFGYGESSLKYYDSWESLDGSFRLSTSGDTVLLYSKDAGGNLVHISGISFSGDWLKGGLDDSEYGTRKSSLPIELEGFSTALPRGRNYKYVGEREGSTASLQSTIGKSENWEGSNDEPYEHWSSDVFTVVAEQCIDFDKQNCSS